MSKKVSNLAVPSMAEVIFTDESAFMLHLADGRTQVHHLLGEELYNICIEGTATFGVGKVHVWRAITSNA